MITQFNFIILEVVVISIFLLFIAIGIFKGVKHTLINFALLLGSLALAFTPFLTVLRKAITDMLSDTIKFGASVKDGAQVGFFTINNMIAGFTLALLFYLLLRVIKALIELGVKHSKKKVNQLVMPPKPVSRVFGAILSLLLNGIVFIALLFVFETPLVGGNKTIEQSYVTKQICKLDDVLVEKVFKDDLLREKALVALIDGNIYQKVDEERAENFRGFEEFVLGDLKLVDTSDAETYVANLAKFVNFVLTEELREDLVEKDGFEAAVDISKTKLLAALSDAEDKTAGVKIPVTNVNDISMLLTKWDISLNDLFLKSFEPKAQ